MLEWYRTSVLQGGVQLCATELNHCSASVLCPNNQNRNNILYLFPSNSLIQLFEKPNKAISYPFPGSIVAFLHQSCKLTTFLQQTGLCASFENWYKCYHQLLVKNFFHESLSVCLSSKACIKEPWQVPERIWIRNKSRLLFAAAMVTILVRSL